MYIVHTTIIARSFLHLNMVIFIKIGAEPQWLISCDVSVVVRRVVIKRGWIVCQSAFVCQDGQEDGGTENEADGEGQREASMDRDRSSAMQIDWKPAGTHDGWDASLRSCSILGMLGFEATVTKKVFAMQQKWYGERM